MSNFRRVKCKTLFTIHIDRYMSSIIYISPRLKREPNICFFFQKINKLWLLNYAKQVKNNLENSFKKVRMQYCKSLVPFEKVHQFFGIQEFAMNQSVIDYSECTWNCFSIQMMSKIIFNKYLNNEYEWVAQLAIPIMGMKVCAFVFVFVSRALIKSCWHFVNESTREREQERESFVYRQVSFWLDVSC